jgi:hypothetical protein
MFFDPTPYTRTEHLNCLSARDVTRLADRYAIKYCARNREIVGYLLTTANELMQTALTLDDLFVAATKQAHAELSIPHRIQILRLSSTCAHNAALFLQEVQRRPIDWRETSRDSSTRTRIA